MLEKQRRRRNTDDSRHNVPFLEHTRDPDSLGWVRSVHYAQLAMDAIPRGNTVEVDLRQLRAFEVLLRERNLTRAATVLGVAQPALSKTLAKLRKYFGDPLFVLAGHRMEPTAKALELAPEVHALLDDATMLRARHRPFDPRTATRTFTFSAVDSG